MNFIQQEINTRLYTDYLFLCQLLYCDLKRSYWPLRRVFVESTSDGWSFIILIFVFLTSSQGRRQRHISLSFLVMGGLILWSNWVVLSWLFVVWVDKVELVCIECKLTGGLMHNILWYNPFFFRFTFLLIYCSYFYRFRCYVWRALISLNTLFQRLIMFFENRCRQKNLRMRSFSDLFF